MTSTRQKSILRGSEIFGYDEKEYPERMLQRAVGWCKAVHVEVCSSYIRVDK